MLPEGQENELINKAAAALLSTGSAFSIDAPEAVNHEPVNYEPVNLEPASPDSLIATAGGIEFLIKLAERGEIDPADVDIIDVTDRFLRAIAAAPKENLRQSGKVLFHASVLLRMKAEALLARRSDVVDDMGDDFLDFDPDGPLIYDSRKQAVARQITLDDLEKALVRRANNRQNRQRKVTLDQLVSALKEAEKIERTRADRKPKSRIQTLGYADVSDVDDILELAHDEDIETVIGKVDRIFDERVAIGESIDLLMLIKLMGTKTDWVDAFLAILFLSNAGKIALEQKDFYGSLHIVRCEPKDFEQKLVVTA